MYRDLKPENLLLVSESDDSAIKLADFGFATIAHGDVLTDYVGTPSYIAPEIYIHSETSTVTNPAPYGETLMRFPLKQYLTF